MAKQRLVTPEEVQATQGANKPIDAPLTGFEKEQKQLAEGKAASARKHGFALDDSQEYVANQIKGQGNIDYMSQDTWDTYKDLNMNHSTNVNWDFERARQQSHWAQFGGAVSQLAGEVVGGAVSGVGLFSSILNPLNSMDDVLNGNVSNILTEAGEGLKEFTQDFAPIYAENPGDFDPGDPAWWAQGSVSVGSFASMLIPAGLTARAFGAVGKLGRVGSLARKITSPIGKVGAAGSKTNKAFQAIEKMVQKLPEVAIQSYVSRKIESTMEAQGVFQEQHDRFVAAGFSHEDATKLAGVAASKTYQDDMKLLYMDMAQYMFLGGATKSMFAPAASKVAEGVVGSTAKKVLGKTGELAFQGSTEALEEGWQFINAEEGKYLSEKMAGIHTDKFNNKTFDDRLDEYLSDPEFKNSAFFGAFGGVMFDTVGPVLEKSVNSNVGRKAGQALSMVSSGFGVAEMRNAFKEQAYWMKKIDEVDKVGSKADKIEVRRMANMAALKSRAHMGMLDQYVGGLEKESGWNEGNISEWNEANPDFVFDPEFKDEMGGVFLQDAQTFQTEYNNAKEQYPDNAVEIAQAKVNQGRYLERQATAQSNKTNMLNATPFIGDMSGLGRQMWDLNFELAEKKDALALHQNMASQLQGIAYEATMEKVQDLQDDIDEKTTALKELEELDKGESGRTSKEKRKDKMAMKTLKSIAPIAREGARAILAGTQIDANVMSLNELQTQESNNAKHEETVDNEAANLDSLEELNGKIQGLDYLLHIGQITQEQYDADKARYEQERDALEAQYNANEEQTHEAQQVEDLERASSNILENEDTYTKESDLEPGDTESTTEENVLASLKTKENADRESKQEDTTGETQQGGNTFSKSAPKSRESKSIVRELVKAGFTKVDDLFGRHYKAVNPFATITVGLNDIAGPNTKEYLVRQIRHDGEIVVDWFDDLAEARQFALDQYNRGTEHAPIDQELQDLERALEKAAAERGANDSYFRTLTDRYVVAKEIDGQWVVSITPGVISGLKPAEVTNFDSKKEAYQGLLDVIENNGQFPKVIETEETIEEETPVDEIPDPTEVEGYEKISDKEGDNEPDFESKRPEKSTLISLAWSSYRTGKSGNNNMSDRVAFADMIELSEYGDLSGAPVEYILDTSVLSMDKIRQRYNSGQSTQIGTIPIKAVVLDSDGSRRTVDGVPVGAWLHSPYRFEGAVTGSAQFEELVTFRAEILDALMEGGKVTGNIGTVGQGKMLEEDNSGVKENGDHEVMNPVSDILPEGHKARLVIGGRDGSFFGGGGVTNESGWSSINFASNFPHLLTIDNNGNNFAVKLNSRALTENEVTTVLELTKKRLEGARHSDQVEGVNGIEGLTYAQAMELLLNDFYPKNSSSKNRFSIEGRQLFYGNQTVDAANFDASIQDLRDWLSNKGNAVLVQKAYKMNEPITLFGSKNNRRDIGGFTFMGKQYTSADSYNDYLTEGLGVSHNKFMENGSMFVASAVSLNRNVNAEFPIARQEVSKVETTNENVGEIETSGGLSEEEMNSLNDLFSRVEETDTPDVADVEAEVEWIRQVLPHVPVQVVNGLIKIRRQGDKAYGAFKNSMIVLSDAMITGTAYHEAFHAVTQLYLTPEQRTDLYAEAKLRYPNPTPADIAKYGSVETYYEEKLAEAFRLYMINQNIKYPSKMKRFFARLWDMVTGVFRNKTITDRLFEDITRGKFNYAPVSTGVNRMTDSTLYKRVDGLTAAQNEAVVSALMADVVKMSKAWESDDVTAIKASHLSVGKLNDIVELWKSQAGAKNNQGLVNMYGVVQASMETVRENILDKFKEFNLTVLNDQAIGEQEATLSEEQKKENLNIKAAFEYSGKDNATGNVKLLISLLPKIGHDGKSVTNVMTGRAQLANASSTWNFLAKGLSGIVDGYDERGNFIYAYDKMMSKLGKLARIRPEVGLLKAKLENPAYPSEKKAQFFNAFSQSVMNFRDTTVRSKKGPKGEFEGYEFRTKDSNFNSIERQMAYEWSDRFLDKISTRTPEGDVIVQGELVELIADEYTQLASEVKENLNNKFYNEDHKFRFARLLALTGLEIPTPALDYMMDFKDGEPRKTRTNIPEAEKLNELLGELKFAFTSGLRGALEKGKLEEWVTSEGGLINVANTAALFNDDLTDSTVRAAGGGQYYAYSQNNYLTKLTQQFKDNPKLIKERLKEAYATNSVFMNQMVGMDQAKLDKVTIEVSNGYRKAGDTSDVGTSYANLSPLDEMAVRVNQTLDGHFSMLTAADKSVWYLLKGVDKVYTDVRHDGKAYNIASVSTTDVFGRYLLDELSRMRKAWHELYGDNPLPEEKRRQYYHGTPSKPGNAFKSYLFPQLSAITYGEDGSIQSISDEAKGLGVFITSKDFKPSWNSQIVTHFRDMVNAKLADLMEQDFQMAIDLGLIGQRPDGSIYNIGI
jgi:hypothetical protein